ncbi:MAG: hypothetical protein JXP34_26270 [Planctomycetes bacterium]|nr:hypothetical protein [Planctomycetota bacterium]
MKCQRCQKEAKVLTPLPDSDEHVCEDCYAAAYRKAHAGGGRRIGVVVGSILGAAVIGLAIYLLIPNGEETVSPTSAKEGVHPAPSSRPPVTPVRSKQTKPSSRTKTPSRTERAKTEPSAPAVAPTEPGTAPPEATGKTEETPATKEGGEEKVETPEAKTETVERPEAENAFVRVAAQRASTLGSLSVRYLLPAETEEEPPRSAQASLTPSVGTFLRLDLEVEIHSGEAIGLGPVALTFGGGTYYPVQWEAFGKGCQGASAQDLVMAQGAALEIFISGDQDDVIAEGGGGYVSRSSYVHTGGGPRVPVALYFDVPERPDGIGVMNVAGLSFDIDFSTLGH